MNTKGTTLAGNEAAVRSIARSGAYATVATTAAIAICGAIENNNPAAPVNAISHMAWGDRSARQERTSIKYTGVGAALNPAARVAWAAFSHIIFKPHERRATPAGALARGAATAGIAYVVDYHVVPERLTPGFEKRLSNGALFAIYAAMAVGLAIGERSAQKKRRVRRPGASAIN